MTFYQCPYCLKLHDEPAAICCGEQHVEWVDAEKLIEEPPCE